MKRPPLACSAILVVLGLAAPRALEAADLELAWNPSAAPAVTGYKVHYGNSSGNYRVSLDAGNRTTFKVSGLAAATYYLAVTAYDGAGAQSPYSNEVVHVVSDGTAPTISAVKASSVTAFDAKITWTTDEAASSTVEYGPTAAYGSATDLNPFLVTAHSQMLTGLLPATLYHYRVVSADAAGNSAASNDATFLTAAAPDPCTYSVSPVSERVRSSSGSGTVAVTSPSGCAWSAASNSDWITVTSGAGGSGSGTVGYAFAANLSASSRTGSLTVADRTVTVTQDGIATSDLSITKSHPGDFVRGAAGKYVITVANIGAATTTKPIAVSDELPDGLSFTSSSGAGWLCSVSGRLVSCTIVDPLAPQSSTTLNLTVQVTAAAPATVTNVARLTSVEDDDAANNVARDLTRITECSLSFSPPTGQVSNGGGVGSVYVSSGTGCTWSVVSQVPWLTIASGGAGTGNGIAVYQAALNSSGTQRTGSLSVRNQAGTEAGVLVVTQAGVPARRLTASISLDAPSYAPGTMVLLTGMRLANEGEGRTIDWRMWLRVPDGSLLALVRLDAIPLGARLVLDFLARGAVPFLAVTSQLPSGIWEVGQQAIDHLTGEVLAAHEARFAIHSTGLPQRSAAAAAATETEAYTLAQALRLFDFLEPTVVYLARGEKP